MKIRKLFPEKRILKRNLMEFFDKRGFYIVLILCIAIVGVTAVFLSTQNFGSSTNELDAQQVVPNEPNTNVSLDTNSKPGDKKKKADISTPLTSGDNSKEVNTSESKKPDDKTKETKNTPSIPKKNLSLEKFTVPVFGEVTFDYAGNKLVYSKTLEDWRTHSGVDLASGRGTPVKAVADGFVSEVINDPRFGITVIIKHNDEIKTVYSNLASDKNVVPNHKVKQGDVIGSVGNTATFESAEQPHLHFEVLKNNKPVDPSKYLPSKK